MFRTIRRACAAIPRQRIDYDVVVVGAGPAGLATAIKFKQLDSHNHNQLSICVLEKGQALGNHILSGNCFQPSGLEQLFANWKEMQNGPPLNTKVSHDQFRVLTSQNSSLKVPEILLPKSIRNEGNYLISLGKLVQWMGQRAQALGVDVFPQTAADQFIYEQERVVGVTTKDLGVSKSGQRKNNFAQGLQIRAKQVVLAEGCRGSISQAAIKKYGLAKDSDPQIYGIGFKQVWQVPAESFKEGLAAHTVGWPLPLDVYGGSFMYHMEENKVHLGMVVGLDYKDPLLNPYNQFQRLKLNPFINKYISRGRCISYGARALNQGGYFSVPKLTFPGGLLVGCSAGFLNVMKIKGSHNAIKSGVLAGESLYQHLSGHSKQSEVTKYQSRVKQSDIMKELYESRNFKNGFKNLPLGLLHGAFLSLTKGAEFYNLRNKKLDHQHYQAPPPQAKEDDPPKGDVCFKLLDNLARSGTNHQHDQPSHLVVKSDRQEVPLKSWKELLGPQTRFCPAKVYQFVQDKLVINAQNCLHCKTCSIKMKEQYIQWRVPESGGGPRYSGM